MSKIYKKPTHCKIEEHQKYISRITKTLYYGKLPSPEMLSLPATELAVEIFSEAHKGKSLNRLHLNTAAEISRNACVSPCSLVLAMLYFERLKKCNIEYLAKTIPSDLFLVSLMVSAKFLFDDGQIDEVFMDEWAASSGMSCKELVKLEREFLNAINWEVYASELAFWRKLNEIEMKLALKQGNSRGFFTYTELGILGELISKDFQNVIQCICAVSVILVAAYTTALIVLFGSVAIASHIPGTSLYNPVTSNEKSPINDQRLMITDETLLSSSNETTIKSNNVKFDAVNVLKTSIFLASIKTENDHTTNLSEVSLTLDQANCERVSWDWWNVPTMNWLTKISEYITAFNIPAIESSTYYLENRAVNEKLVHLKDYIHKATKTRIQDQLERSWHVEWIDTVKQHLKCYNLLTYLQNIKP
ncbi:hypothetical protein ABEB36_002424 [Hypothenemus hampei]|uniref:Protein CNPPD1 n=1 Tax=Hypothenemus hampei TaxID=57062 RepID=A0ABD1F638_HYPHA